MRGFFIAPEATVPIFQVVNPAKRKVSRKARPARRKQQNPGPIGGLLISMANGKKTKSTKKKAKNPGIKVVTRYRNTAKKDSKERNPASRRNPFSIGGNGPRQIGELALGAFGGAIATRALTEKVLGAHNKGPKGYLGNIVVALGLGWAGNRFVSPLVGAGLLAGGGGTIVQRFWDEHVAKLVPAAALAITGGESAGEHMGDLSYSETGAAALNGYYEATYHNTLELGERYGAPVPVPAHHSVHLDTISA
jgi:hypothetical protein